MVPLTSRRTDELEVPLVERTHGRNQDQGASLPSQAIRKGLHVPYGVYDLHGRKLRHP